MNTPLSGGFHAQPPLFCSVPHATPRTEAAPVRNHTDTPATCPDCGGKRSPKRPTCQGCYLDGLQREHEPPVSVLRTRFRCRAHLSQPVTWRGTGCLECSRTEVES